jgi:excisionase family DNA binding protein
MGSARHACSLSLAIALFPLATLAAGDPPAQVVAPVLPEVLTLDEAARFLRLKPQVVAELARSNSLPARYVGGEWRFLRAALMEWLKGDRFAEAGKPAQPAPAPAPLPVKELQGLRAGGPAGAAGPDAPAPPSRPAASAVEPVGEKPNVRTAEETALRDQGVLLPAGRTSVEAGLSYARAERQNYGLLRVVQNTATANLALRYGLRDDLQISARLPATYRRVSTNVIAALGESAQTSDRYAGDLSASLLGVLAHEGAGRPNVILSGDVILPTGPGDRGLGAGVVMSKSFDPVVLFGGASYMHGFHTDAADVRRVLGDHNFGFNFGYAYAVNDSVALSGAFIGSYRTNPRGAASGALVPSRESYQLQLGATMQLGRGLFIEPTVGVGIGGASPDVTISVNVPYTF